MRGTARWGTTALWACLSCGCGPGEQPKPPTVTDLTVFDLDRERPPTAPVAEPPRAETQRATVVAGAGDVELSASSTYEGWPLENATDGDEQTSWYSDRDDSVAKGKSPFFQLAFGVPRRVRHVTILGNRDPRFFDGFAIRRGRLDVVDGRGRTVQSLVARGSGDRADFVFDLPDGTDASALRFTSLEDDGARNPWGDVAIGEVRVE